MESKIFLSVSISTAPFRPEALCRKVKAVVKIGEEVFLFRTNETSTMFYSFIQFHGCFFSQV